MGKCVGGKLKGIISCFNKQSGHQIDTRMIKIGNDFKHYFEFNHTIYKINRQKQLHYRSNPAYFCYFLENFYVRAVRKLIDLCTIAYGYYASYAGNALFERSKSIRQ